MKLLKTTIINNYSYSAIFSTVSFKYSNNFSELSDFKGTHPFGNFFETYFSEVVKRSKELVDSYTR